MLCFCIADGAERQSERVCNEDRPRRLDDRRDFDHLSDRDRAQSALVEPALDQPHGLLTNRSSRGQQHQVGAVGHQPRRHGGAGFLDRGAVSAM